MSSPVGGGRTGKDDGSVNVSGGGGRREYEGDEERAINRIMRRGGHFGQLGGRMVDRGHV